MINRIIPMFLRHLIFYIKLELLKDFKIIIETFNNHGIILTSNIFTFNYMF